MNVYFLEKTMSHHQEDVNRTARMTWNWRQEPETEAGSEMYLHTKAVGVLTEMLENENEELRLRAAEIILKYSANRGKAGA
ncbi:hypothetical protein MJA45_03625 [Paenibacillus aurantius]|uniref:Uncharacterized protein n=1 Tax=Paenibacillus aurantius TaxID=2918900 RepID=A0AA96LHL6_9BACL|nr:hypothetical protein [Paenibacillus aurantius]WNQ12151.1 hypothetical protein MJA45_03625 [Paenibacillus aurantius]